MMRTIEVGTHGRGLYGITQELRVFAREAGYAEGLLVAFCRHTSCSLLIQENADPDVRTDLEHFFERLAPEGMEFITHDSEGPDDMPAHIRSALTQTSIAIPMQDGAPLLGTWQGLYLFEHRRRPHRRRVILQAIPAG
jgi:secondary thiamine-phosphate synthase enzyme